MSVFVHFPTLCGLATLQTANELADPIVRMATGTHGIGLGIIKLGNIDIASALNTIKLGTIASLLYRHWVPSNLVLLHRYRIGIGYRQFWYHRIVIVSALGTNKFGTIALLLY